MRHRILLPLGLLLCCRAACQEVPVERIVPDSAATYRFELHEGALVTGRVRAVSADSLHVLHSAGGSQAIAKADIAKAAVLRAREAPPLRAWFEHPVPSRLLVGHTAIAMRKGELRYTNTYFLFHAVSAGLTDRLAMSAGVEWTSFINPRSPGPIVFGSLKYGGEVADGVHLAAHGMWLSTPYNGWLWSDPGRLNLGFAGALITLGDADRQLTAGLSWSVLSFRWATRSPLITLGGQWRLSRRLAFLSENRLLPIPGESAPYLLSYALRILGRRTTLDLGFLNNGFIARRIAPGVPFGAFGFRF
ncbi:MAG: hypothetical protein ACK4L7_02045 [Flavobacteriales bacterium]